MQHKSLETIHARLRTARERAGLTLIQLAQRTGYASTTLSAIENGHDRPSKRLLDKWIEAIQLNSAWLETGEGEVFRVARSHTKGREEAGLAAPIRDRIRKVRERASDLLQEIDQLEQEVLQPEPRRQARQRH